MLEKLICAIKERQHNRLKFLSVMDAQCQGHALKTKWLFRSSCNEMPVQNTYDLTW